MKIDHPWKLAGPWYRWHDPGQVPLPNPLPDDSQAGNPALGRLSRPIFQKYASSNFVEQFLDDPRCSLRFDQRDFVHEVIELPAAEVSKRRLSNKAYRKTAANRRKIFLNTHNRFYLVVCELHCDAPGFPSVSPDQTCEAGFVVRRRRAPVPATIRPELEVVLGKIARARYEIATSRRKSTTQKGRVRMMPQGTVDETHDAARQRQVERRSSQLQQAQAELQALVQKHGIQLLVEGWVPSGGDGLGAWQKLDDELPQCSTEELLPLYPVRPDPRNESHAAVGKNLWFGLLPTGSSDSDRSGNPRYDDRHTYEVRCFVRRHNPHCRKTAERRDCQGEVVWSSPTESYQLAPQFDLDGTSHRRITIQLPDLNALEAQVSDPEFQMGQGVGVAMVTPGGSELDFEVDGDNQPIPKGRSSLPSICFFSIPLITIVATFVLRLFLPIVVFLFGLWFLLRLKFCILPTFSIDGDLSVDLEAELNVELSLEVDLSVQLQGRIDLALDSNLSAPVANGLKADLDPRARGQMVLDLATDFRQSAPEDIQFPGAAPAARPAALPSEEERLPSYCDEEATI